MNIGVHTSHCCERHGCKYGNDDCPVVLGTHKQQFDCEECDYHRCKICGSGRGCGCSLTSPLDTKRLDFFEENQGWFRYSSHPSMCGTYPCWIVWTPKEGTTKRKTLREAIDAAME